MSSSRFSVASLRLSKSVALSLLRLLIAAISFCKLVAIDVRLRSWLEKSYVVFGRGVEGVEGRMLSMLAIISSGTFIVCNASMVEDGGVFSPSMGRGAFLVVGRSAGVSLRRSLPAGVGVMLLSVSFILSLPYSTKLLLDAGRSGDRSGERLLSM